MSSTNSSNLSSLGVAPTPPSNGSSFNPIGYTVPGPVTSDQSDSWFKAMAQAWGKILDKQANEITTLSSQVGEQGQDQPSTMTLLTAASLKMQFISQNESTSMNAVGEALQTSARKS